MAGGILTQNETKNLTRPARRDQVRAIFPLR